MAGESIDMVSARVSQHEAVCAERWGQIRKQLDQLERGVSGINNRFLMGAGAMIAGMAGLIVTLVLRGH